MVGVKRTSVARLLLLAAVGLVVAWPLDLISLQLLGGFLPIGPTGSGVIAVWAQALAIWGWLIRERLPRPARDDEGNPIVLRAPNPLPPLQAARTLAIALAASRAGSLLAGCYAGLAVAAASNLGLQIARDHLVLSAATTALSLLLAAVGLWVERLCALPPTPPSNASSATTA